MWGGRFEGGPAELMRAINSSIGTDKRLWREDVDASLVHAGMLVDTEESTVRAWEAGLRDEGERGRDEVVRLREQQHVVYRQPLFDHDSIKA